MARLRVRTEDRARGRGARITIIGAPARRHGQGTASMVRIPSEEKAC